MKTFVLIFLIMSNYANDKNEKAAFGSDDRLDIYQTSLNIQKYSSGVANWQSPLFIEETESGFQLDFPSLGEEWGLCSGEKFLSQPTTMIACTGFLVAPDLLMTAGHCMVNTGFTKDEVTPQCSDFNWMFDFKYDRNPKQEILRDKDPNSIVGCQKVIYAVHNENSPRRDYALIKLDRKLKNRYIFPIDSKKVAVGDKVALLGHPSGLPMKFSGVSRVLRIKKGAEYFEANLDSFGGNSGSPVFDKQGRVRGILVRGPSDFVHDKKNNCDRWNQCALNGKNCIADDPTDDTEDWNSGMHVQIINQKLIDLVNNNK